MHIAFIDRDGSCWSYGVDPGYCRDFVSCVSVGIYEFEGKFSVFGEGVFCGSTIIGYDYSCLVEGDRRDYVSTGS